jgi:hypothetical protein
MIRSRLGIKALGLCALVLGLMAISASGAQASEWYYRTSPTGTLTAMGDLLPLLTGELENQTGSLLFTTKGGTAVKIECRTAKPESGKLKEGGKSTEGTVKFSECEIFLNGTLTANCTPVDGGAIGVIRTKKVLILIALHETETTALVEPETGTTLLEIELGAKCAIGEVVPVTGELILVDCNKEFTKHKKVHLVTEHSTLHELKALGQPATLDGSALIRLAGAHESLEWAGLHF